MARYRSLVLVGAVGLLVLAVYHRTLYPGLVGTGDTPELQFVGRVLGTAHTPGYPIFVLVSWAFGHLPVGSLAYRINLLSAVLGAVSAALLALILLRLRCRPAVAASVSLAFAFGRTFWSQAILAEVYTMAAALLLATLLGLITWAETRSPVALSSVFGFSALALAHHSVDIVVVVPAIVWFALITDAGSVLRPRVIAGAMVAVLCGVAAYGWVLLRTRQGAAYLGARASNPSDVLDLLRGGRFAGLLFAFDVRTVLLERLPGAARVLRGEMGIVGLALLVVGVAIVLHHRRREAVLFLVGAAGVLSFVLNYNAPDLNVFLIPFLILLWPLVAIGLEAVLSRVRPVPPVVLTLAVLAFPATALRGNYRVNDHSRRNFEDRYFRAVFEMLPDRAAIVYESYTVEQMLRYELLGEGYARKKDVALSGRDPESLAAYRRQGHALFAFERGARELALSGWALAPIVLPSESLEDSLKRLPHGSVAVWAGASPRSPVFAGLAPGMGECTAAARVAGADWSAERNGAVAAELTVPAGVHVGATGFRLPVPFRAVCRSGAGEVEVGGKSVVRNEFGLALAVLAPSGRVVQRYELTVDAEPLVPFNPRAFPLYRLMDEPVCAEIANRGFVDITGESRGGRLLIATDNAASFDSEAVVWLAAEQPIRPQLSETAGFGSPELEVSEFLTGAAATRAALAADGLAPSGRLAAAPHLSRLRLTVNDQGQSSTAFLDLGGLPSAAVARGRADRDDPWRVKVCGLPAGGAPLFALSGERAASLHFGPAVSPFLGPGWHGPEREGPLGFRWSAEKQAVVLVPLARRGHFRVEIHAQEHAGGAETIELDVNGHRTGPRPLRAGWASYEWIVPETAWREGTNRLEIMVPRTVVPTGRDGRRLGVAVARLRLILLDR